MRFAYPMQKIQDWITQQWVILGGKKIDSKKNNWLIGPFGNLEPINKNYIHKLAEKENLIVDKETKTQGLIPSIQQLHLPESEFSQLSLKVIDFYENTSNYNLSFSVKWNPFFKFFGILLQKLFSNRLNQLNIPTQTLNSESIISKVITLREIESKQTKYVFWLRTLESTKQSIYSGSYGVCKLPSGEICIKAVFPLPNGNATVIMIPKIETNGGLSLNSSGKEFGNAGFYFLLKDSKDHYWSRYIRSFRDKLIINEENDHLIAEQTLTLWRLTVLKFHYKIHSIKQ